MPPKISMPPKKSLPPKKTLPKKQILPPDCTITLTPTFDEFGEVGALVSAVPDFFQVPIDTRTRVIWNVINNTNADEEVKIRGFHDKDDPAGPHDPYQPVTKKLKAKVEDVNSGKNIGQIEMDLDRPRANKHHYKYNVQVGKFVALDPELEIV